jgi:glutathione S-transferase
MAKTNLEVFWVSGSPYAWRVLLTLEVKQLEYASHLLEAWKGHLQTPEYMQLNSRGTVPTLKDGDLVVRESLAIMAYLDGRYPEPSLFGGNAQQIAKIWRLISECLSYLHVPATRIIHSLYFGKAAEKRDDILAAVPEVHAELARFEGELARSTWFGGEAICAADIAIYPFMKSLVRAAAKEPGPSLSLGLLPLAERYPGLAAWMQGVEQIPGYHNTYPPHWRQ